MEWMSRGSHPRWDIMMLGLPCTLNTHHPADTGAGGGKDSSQHKWCEHRKKHRREGTPSSPVLSASFRCESRCGSYPPRRGAEKTVVVTNHLLCQLNYLPIVWYALGDIIEYFNYSRPQVRIRGREHMDDSAKTRCDEENRFPFLDREIMGFHSPLWWTIWRLEKL